MVDDKNRKHRNKPNRMSDYYKEYVCKHLTHLFPRRVSYNRFVELEKEVLLQLLSSSRKSCWALVPVSALWIPIPYVYAGTNAY